MYRRKFEIGSLIKKNRALIIYGPRRVGKTTLLNEYLNHCNIKYKLDSGDNIRVREVLGSSDFNRIKEYASGYELIAIDEAQNIPDVGMGIKILVDEIKDLKIIATGSSSFKLKQAAGEPLTGRKSSIILTPLSQEELNYSLNRFDLKERLEEYLIFGNYPEVLNAVSRKEKILILMELVESYMLKDIFNMYQIKGSRQLVQMLKLLAFQVGNLVSINEISMHIGMDVKTVARYLDLLEKGFVLRSLGGFSKNLRDEIVAKSKYYFFDNGIRNALIGAFNNLTDRNDTGQLFENFMLMEFWKKKENNRDYSNFYFWRNYAGNEIDLIIEKDGIFHGYEFKWSESRKVKIPLVWQQAYPKASYTIINKENYLNHIL